MNRISITAVVLGAFVALGQSPRAAEIVSTQPSITNGNKICLEEDPRWKKIFSKYDRNTLITLAGQTGDPAMFGPVFLVPLVHTEKTSMLEAIFSEMIGGELVKRKILSGSLVLSDPCKEILDKLLAEKEKLLARENMPSPTSVPSKKNDTEVTPSNQMMFDIISKKISSMGGASQKEKLETLASFGKTPTDKNEKEIEPEKLLEKKSILTKVKGEDPARRKILSKSLMLNGADKKALDKILADEEKSLGRNTLSFSPSVASKKNAIEIRPGQMLFNSIKDSPLNDTHDKPASEAHALLSNSQNGHKNKTRTIRSSGSYSAVTQLHTMTPEKSEKEAESKRQSDKAYMMRIREEYTKNLLTTLKADQQTVKISGNLPLTSKLCGFFVGHPNGAPFSGLEISTNIIHLPPVLATWKNLKKLVIKLPEGESPEDSKCNYIFGLRNVAGLSKLTELIASKANLYEIPEAIGSLKNLKEVDFSGNRLESLPLEFSNLLNVTHINLAGNKFKSFPEEVLSFLGLKTVNLSNNLIEEFPSNLIANEKIESIILTGNPIKNKPQEFDSRIIL